MEDSAKKLPLPSPIFPGADSADHSTFADRKKTPNETRPRPPQTPIKATPQQSKIASSKNSLPIILETTPVRSLQEGGFDMVQPLSHGSFGQVFSCKKEGKSFACKIIPLTGSGQGHRKQEAEREVHYANLFARGGHPNILEYIKTWQDGGFCHLQSELCKSDLRDLLAREQPDESDVLNFIFQMLQGVAFIHSFGVVHMDLKPENILVSFDDTIKICDFGHTTKFGCWSTDKLGEASYVAPEILKYLSQFPIGDEDRQGVSVVSPAVDVWALGMILFEMVTGFDLPRRQDIRENLQKLQHPFTWQWLENFGLGPKQAPSVELQQLLSRMLDPNPETRVTTTEALKLEVFSSMVCPLDLSKVDTIGMEEKLEHSSLDDLSRSPPSSPTSLEDDEEDDNAFLMTDSSHHQGGKKQKIDNFMRELHRRESFEISTGELRLSQDLGRLGIQPKSLLMEFQ